MLEEYLFVNPELLQKINAKVSELANRWNYAQSDVWQLWQMVATIESGRAQKTFYHNGGIVFDGWNGYKDYPDVSCNPDPDHAHGGFYRMEPAQMVGWTLYLVWQAEPSKRASELERVSDVYHLHRVYWEDKPMLWGWKAFQDFYTQEEAESVLEQEKTRKGFKRGTVEFSEMSWMYRLTVENSRAKPKLRDSYKARIEP